MLHLNQIIPFLRIKSFDSSTYEGRSAERYRRVTLTAITSFAAKGIGIFTGIISVPLTLHYLGTERFGLWATICSVTMMLVFADFGLGNGLINAIAQADGENDRESAQYAVSSTFYLLSGISLILASIFVIAYPFINWSRIFNVSSQQAMYETGPAMFAFFMFFLMNLPLGVVQRVQFGYQEGYLNNLWQIVGNVASLICLLIAIKLQASLCWLVVAMSGAPIIVLSINWLFEFIYKRKWLYPQWKYFKWEKGKLLIGAGTIFMLLTVVNVLGTGSDNIIIAQFLGVSAVSTYSVLQKLFSITFLVQFMISPFWPAFNESISRGDITWARRTFLQANKIAIISTLAICGLLLLCGRYIIAIWAGSEVVPPWSLLVAYTAYRIVTSSNEALVAILSTGKFIRKQLIIAATAGIAAIILKIFLVSVFKIDGVPWGGAVAYGIFYLIPAQIFVFYKFMKLSNTC